MQSTVQLKFVCIKLLLVYANAEKYIKNFFLF